MNLWSMRLTLGDTLMDRSGSNYVVCLVNYACVTIVTVTVPTLPVTVMQKSCNYVDHQTGH